MFTKILIANRGEIACRIIKTARRLNIATVAVYSDVDKNLPHVHLADEAVCIGAAPSRQSYLDGAKIIQAAKQTQAEAVHPGYGFLSENAEFVSALNQAGICFIGPSAETIDAMGDKIQSRRIAEKAGVSVIPGFSEAITDVNQALNNAHALGYPVMIKASAGGGGKGLRVAYDDAQLHEHLESCRNEAANAFGDDRIFIEKFIAMPRHIEIQILGDQHGKVIHLGERECSIQRRHQKVIEEAPSPILSPETRQKMGAQAVKLAKNVGYYSAGTVEFVYGADGTFYFLEMNTRLQVEHPVTEMITGLDLVEQMLRVAAGEALTHNQADINIHGAAIECRINCEDPSRDFLPVLGRIRRLHAPQSATGLGSVRLDAGFSDGDTITPYYDSMIAKLICHGSDRRQAIATMQHALDTLVVDGVQTNAHFHSALLSHAHFHSGQFDTSFIAQHYPNGFQPPEPSEDMRDNFLAVMAFMHFRQVSAEGSVGQLQHAGQGRWLAVVPANGTDPHRVLAELSLEAMHDNGRTIAMVCDSKRFVLHSNWRKGQTRLDITINGNDLTCHVVNHQANYRVLRRGYALNAQLLRPDTAELLARLPQRAKSDSAKLLLSPMPGLLTTVNVAVGDAIKAGQRIATIEAMKMENVLKAETDAIVAEILCESGVNVAIDQPLIRFT